VGDSGLFSITLDAGETWNTTFLIDATSIQLSSVCFTSPLTGYVGGRSEVTEGIIYKTIDGGITWNETVTPESVFDRDYKRIVFPTPEIGYALTRGMCMKTTDAGDHWYVTDTALVSSGGMFSILEDGHFFSADTGYIVGWYNGFSGFTVNGGNNWTDQLISNNQWYGVDFPSREIGYMVGWGQLMKTEDGGTTWTDKTSELISTGAIYSMDFTDDETGYVCGEGGLILKTTNGGTTRSHDLGNTSDFLISPNPSVGLVHINLSTEIPADEFSIMVYTLLGEKVWATDSISLPATIELGNLSTGVYVVVASTREAQYVRKLILQ
jgi:photosystem II stability/assembly factor-like uncharacterized protein